MTDFRTLITTTSLLTALAFTATAQTAEEEIAAARAAAMKYIDVNVALADGFVPDPSGACVSASEAGLPAEMGAMGVHYLNMALLQLAPGARVDGTGTHTDFTRPAILIYEPQEDGSMALVGVENLVFQQAWADAGNSEPPSFGGTPWDAMADDNDTDGDEAHGFAPHYDRHVWVMRDNPAGILVPFNPAVSCAYHKPAG
jgi:hypothetical protein